jgi:hypothetical protein
MWLFFFNLKNRTNIEEEAFGKITYILTSGGDEMILVTTTIMTTLCQAHKCFKCILDGEMLPRFINMC